ncbi:IS4 family transposase [Beijerinckia sp. L45]|uniref:IS4 family transposase n=1 Tax=Beijerinckia sp. L45 TaxID=1641855 RepID=UPI00131C1907|nr:IS4 family transposase [Beijerinckia sp. L45]
MVACASVCLRRLAGGHRRGIVGFSRFLANPRVTAEALIEGWGLDASAACAGRHILAIQDTSEITFTTVATRRRGLGEIGKGNGRGVLLHAMLGLDADTGGILGLVAGRVWTRAGRVSVPHAARLLADKESERWLTTAETAKTVLAGAAMITEISDRESDIYAKWARVPAPGFHMLTRAMHDRAVQGGTLSSVALTPAGEAAVTLRARPGRLARTARLTAGYARVNVRRPRATLEKGMPETVSLTLVEVREIDAPEGVEPILWRLLTTHRVEDPAMAWRIVDWYRQRWHIEQVFRTLKQQGLHLEDSQLETAERLIKLTALAVQAAVLIMQLVQARDGQSEQDAAIAFSPAEIETLKALVPTLEGKTVLQKNHHPPGSLAWAAWAIAKLGGWDGYPKSKPPGPITFTHGLSYFRAIAQGRNLQNV